MDYKIMIRRHKNGRPEFTGCIVPYGDAATIFAKGFQAALRACCKPYQVLVFTEGGKLYYECKKDW